MTEGYLQWLYLIDVNDASYRIWACDLEAAFDKAGLIHRKRHGETAQLITRTPWREGHDPSTGQPHRVRIVATPEPQEEELSI